MAPRAIAPGWSVLDCPEPHRAWQRAALFLLANMGAGQSFEVFDSPMAACGIRRYFQGLPPTLVAFRHQVSFTRGGKAFMNPAARLGDVREAGRKGGQASGHARRRKKNLREALLAVLESPVPDSIRAALAPELVGLDVGDVLVEQLCRDALNGDSRARDKILDLCVPKSLEVSVPEQEEPYLVPSSERREKLREMLLASNGIESDGAAGRAPIPSGPPAK